MKNLPIRLKINGALLVVFVLVLIASISYSAYSERQLVEAILAEQTVAAADAYFDSVNTMMVTGTMAQRDVARTKVLARPNVLEARIMRSEPVKIFGPGLPQDQPKDELDARALAGESVAEIRKTPDGRVLTVVNPVLASKDYRGTNCLMCHVTEEGSVLGAVRVSYSLKSLDDKVLSNLATAGGIQIAMFAAGLLVMVLLLNYVVTGPISRLRATMEGIERDSDLSRRIDPCCRDEIGITAETFNRMMERMHGTIGQVATASHRISEVAGQVMGISNATVSAALDQRNETDQVAAATNELNASAQEVAGTTGRTAEASAEVNEEAGRGADGAEVAVRGIEEMIGGLDGAAEAVKSLDNQRANINSVLDVIRAIAEQTNLLALNAAIEAARAGEQGRGFAVVADEVRQLATRTHESTSEIQQMIAALQGEVERAVEAMHAAQERGREGAGLVSGATDSLKTISDKVSSISDLNLEIATAARQQQEAAESINRSMVSIHDLAEKTSDGAHDTAELNKGLSELSHELEELVGRFRI